ncbi:MAG: AraC family transcriptional regulator [Rubrivivax sp.]|nr:MAG: AraC family transcriptional regulator [Rubrivivax sp.]
MYDIFSFCSGVLGLFLAVPLIALQRQRSANGWIGLFVLSVSLLSFSSTQLYRELHSAHPAWFGVLDWPVTVLGASYLCYVRSMVGLSNGWRQAWHFLLLPVFLAILVAARFQVYFDLTLFFIGCEVWATVQTLAAMVHLQRYRQQLRENYSSLKNRDLVWLSWLSVVVILILLNCVLASAYGGIWHWLLLGYRILILYFVGWFGLRQVVVFVPHVGLTTVAPDTPSGPEAPLAVESEAEKYARSGMNETLQARIAAKLGERMGAARDYLESDLTLTELAERIGTSPQLLSQYLNDTLGLSFFDYVNGLRVAEVQHLMADPAQPRATLLDLALAAGFNSKSTFNAAFRKIGGTTPSEWRRLNISVSEPIR